MISVKNFVEDLQQLVEEHGEEGIVSIVTARGQIDGLEDPFVIHTWGGNLYYLPSICIRFKDTVCQTISHKEAEKVRKWLDPDTPNDQVYQGTETIAYVAFSDNRDMEMRYCKTPDGSSYVEAVLRARGTGHPLAHTDVRFDFLGSWTIQHGSSQYTLVLTEGE